MFSIAAIQTLVPPGISGAQTLSAKRTLRDAAGYARKGYTRCEAMPAGLYASSQGAGNPSGYLLTETLRVAKLCPQGYTPVARVRETRLQQWTHHLLSLDSPPARTALKPAKAGLLV
uniref:Uncharacterized protein n=1 Tax=Tolypothrix bouteillei VB521301 TaxID=1479485 RepID=A0A0C1NH21_9CYAN